jgi:Acetyltransferase (GNAT) domain
MLPLKEEYDFKFSEHISESTSGGNPVKMSVVVAREVMSIADLDAACQIRYKVFVEELGVFSKEQFSAGRQIDSFDTLPTTRNFIAFDSGNGEPVATVRLGLQNDEVATLYGSKYGLDFERYFKLKYIPDDALIADLPKSSVLKKYRGGGALLSI